MEEELKNKISDRKDWFIKNFDKQIFALECKKEAIIDFETMLRRDIDELRTTTKAQNGNTASGV